MVPIAYILGKSKVKKIFYEFVSCLHFFLIKYSLNFLNLIEH